MYIVAQSVKNTKSGIPDPLKQPYLVLWKAQTALNPLPIRLKIFPQIGLNQAFGWLACGLCISDRIDSAAARGFGAVQIGRPTTM